MQVLGKTNADVIACHKALISKSVVARLRLLSQGDIYKFNAHELVQNGFCDPIRLFVKQEPHSEEKRANQRFRLIMSVSLVDQIIERLLFGSQNKEEIRRWMEVPSKPGMGLSDVQLEQIWKEFSPLIGEAAQSDVQGWDWSVKAWELEADAEMRIALTNCPTQSMYAKCVRNRVRCLSLSVFSLSDGTLIEQLYAGIQKSGSYNTSSTNSRMRVLVARLIGAKWAKAMGDDCVEQYVVGAVEKYLTLGHVLKQYEPCCKESFVFCSQLFSMTPSGISAEPVNWARMFYRLLNQTKHKQEALMQFKYEMRHSPHLNVCLEALALVGWVPTNYA